MVRMDRSAFDRPHAGWTCEQIGRWVLGECGEVAADGLWENEDRPQPAGTELSELPWFTDCGFRPRACR